MKSIRWGWVIAGGMIAEAAVWVVLLSLSLLFTGGISRPPAGSSYWATYGRWFPACFFGPFLTTFWLGRWKITSRHVLHGFLIGLVCFILGPPILGPYPRNATFITLAMLKIAGATMGGLIASKRSQPVFAGTRGTTGAA